MFYLKQLGFAILGIIIVAIGFVLRTTLNDNQGTGSIVLLVGLVVIEESLRKAWKYKRTALPTSAHAQSHQQ